MAKRKSTKEQTTIYKTLHSKQTKDRVTQTPLKPGVNSSASEGFMFDASVSYNLRILIIPWVYPNFSLNMFTID
jgi:hypothetical protein